MSIDAMFRLDGKVAVVTGGSRTLGLDMATVLAQAGADIIITSRTAASAKASAAKLAKDTGREVIGFGLDVTSHRQIAKFTEKAWKWKGRVDILVNNAGGGSGNSPGHMFLRDPKDELDLIMTNLVGALWCCKEFGKLMAKRKTGKIINIASIAGLCGRDRKMYERSKMSGQPIDYAAAKAGVIGMTRDLAGLLSPMGINVNSISPGGFERGQPAQFIKDYSAVTAMGRMGRDGIDIKGATLFLASPASDYVTGDNILVDGGFVIWK